MLSRIAESLYWIGRYVERAEDTARILDIHRQLMLREPWTDEDRACRSLLSVMGAALPDGSPATLPGVVERLGLDVTSPGSVMGALSAARENARGARETIPADMWETLNTTWHGLATARQRIDQRGLVAFFRWVRERCSVLAGVADATMSRDEGWLFLVLGRSVERVDMTARLLSTHTSAGGTIPSWLTLLRACGAWETYLRTYRGAFSDRGAAEFLLLDRLFPRSVLSALMAAEGCLTELEATLRTGRTARVGSATDAQRLIGRARTDLAYRSPEELIADLGPVLERLERTCSQVNDAVSVRYFRQTAAVAWQAELVA
ncbi:MAG TPA: alpha-E domain-containing protein [Micromonosporaceae bacterium]|nr:alpha-E domain-containing protein [Micromonosporaceae bacterium]